MAPIDRDDSGIQPATPDTVAPELREFEKTAEARRLADVDLLNHLMWEGYEGPDYEEFANLLARYGIAVIGKWCRDNSIFKRCLSKGYPVTNRGRLNDGSLFRESKALAEVAGL